MATNHEKALRDDIDMVSGGTVKFRMERHLEAMLAELSRLRAALQPFAEFAKAYLPNSDALGYPDHVSVAIIHAIEGPPVTIEVGHLRTALSALEDT